LIFRIQEELATCKSGAPTQIGGNSSSMKLTISVTLMPEEENALMFNTVKMLKVNQF
jgi:hypothetical protein